SRSRTDLQSVYNATLQGQHSIGDHLNVDWSAAYSRAWQKMPDRATLSLHQVFVDTTGQMQPYYPGPQIDGMERLWTHNTDQDSAGEPNLRRNSKPGHHTW